MIAPVAGSRQRSADYDGIQHPLNLDLRAAGQRSSLVEGSIAAPNEAGTVEETAPPNRPDEIDGPGGSAAEVLIEAVQSLECIAGLVSSVRDAGQERLADERLEMAMRRALGLQDTLRDLLLDRRTQGQRAANPGALG